MRISTVNTESMAPGVLVLDLPLWPRCLFRVRILPGASGSNGGGACNPGGGPSPRGVTSSGWERGGGGGGSRPGGGGRIRGSETGVCGTSLGLPSGWGLSPGGGGGGGGGGRGGPWPLCSWEGGCTGGRARGKSAGPGGGGRLSSRAKGTTPTGCLASRRLLGPGCWFDKRRWSRLFLIRWAVDVLSWNSAAVRDCYLLSILYGRYRFSSHAMWAFEHFDEN